MDDIFKAMEERANDLECVCEYCSDGNPICNVCKVSVDQARLMAALKVAMRSIDPCAEEIFDNINKILRGDCDK